MHLKVDDEVVFCMRCCFFVRRQASGVQMPPVRAGLFRGGHFRGKLWPAGCNCGYVTESCAPSHDVPLRVLPPHDWQ